MKIAVLVKHVPDASGNRSFGADGTVDRSADGLLCELDEYAVEQALQIATARDDAGQGEVEIVALTMGPVDAAGAIKRALQMGCGSGVHVCDESLHGSDALATSAVLAAAVRTIDPDLVICGMASTDGGMGVVPVMLAERLGWPAATRGRELRVEGQALTVQRDDDAESLVVEAQLPAVVSVTDQSGEPRYPSMRGILAAKRKQVRTFGLADLGIDPGSVGLAAAGSRVVQAAPRPPKQPGRVVVDQDGSGAAALVEFLVTGKYA